MCLFVSVSVCSSVCLSVHHCVCLLSVLQSAMESLASSMESRERKIKRLEAKFSAVEDEIFGQFCAQVGLQDIR